MTYPDWVLKQKGKGTEIRKIGNNFYLYKVTSIWDKEKSEEDYREVSGNNHPRWADKTQERATDREHRQCIR